MTNIKESLDKHLMYYNKIVTVAIFFILGGTVFYHLVERFSWLDALYFSVVTLATVGYGDFAPKTAAGKVFTIFYILIGITIFVALARVVLARFIDRRMSREESRKKQ